MTKIVKMNEKIFAKEERKNIFKLFLDKDKLEFNEIQKMLNMRSNNLAYHIKTLVEGKILIKKDNYYFITAEASKYIPLFSNLSEEKLSPLPVVLVGLLDETKNKILLMKRTKRPYQNYLGLIGGRMLYNENYVQTSLRLIQNKTRIEKEKLDFISLNHITDEKVYKDEILTNSFILFFTKVITKQTEFENTKYGKLEWFDLNEIEDNKNEISKKIIPSDLWLIRNFLNSKLNISEIKMIENNEKLVRFDVI